MTSRRSRQAVAAGVGVALAAVYVATVVLAGSRDLLVRRPLLDGFITPQPYNWVRPPAALRKQNKRPAAGTFTIPLAPRTGSPAKVVTTRDSQASLAIAQGAIKPSNGAASATLSITPLASSGFPGAVGRALVVGNVYRYAVTIEPGGTTVTKFLLPGQVVLFYPAPPARTGYHHDLLYSADGKSWTKLQSIDSPTQQLVQADADAPGYFAAGQTLEVKAGGGGRSWGNLIVTVVVVAIVAAIVIAILVSEIRLRSRRAEGEWREAERQGGAGAAGRARADRRRRDRRRRP